MLGSNLFCTLDLVGAFCWWILTSLQGFVMSDLEGLQSLAGEQFTGLLHPPQQCSAVKCCTIVEEDMKSMVIIGFNLFCTVWKGGVVL